MAYYQDLCTTGGGMFGYYVYLLASGRRGTLYLGITSDLIRRVYQHKNKLLGGFTARYGVDRLVCHRPRAPRRRKRLPKRWRPNLPAPHGGRQCPAACSPFDHPFILWGSL